MHFFCLKMLGVVLLLAGCSQKNGSTKESGTEKGTASTANNSGLRSAETNDTDAATNDMSGVLLDALKNKRLHFGTQLFKPFCIQFNHNGTVGIFPPEGKIERVTYSMRGLRVGFHEGEEEIDFEIKYYASVLF